jgi:hypothetical protein
LIALPTMKTSAVMLLAAPLAANAHYIFSQLFVNDQAQGGDYEYIRKNSNSYMPTFTQTIVNSNDLRCNEGAMPGSTKTMAVKAGDKLGFKLWFNELIEHPGPGFVYMSKAPGAVNEYDGSGDWFKVFETGLCGSNPGVDADWCTWQKDRIEFTLPDRLPPGEYLVRVEHIGIHEGHVGKAQFYMECAQIAVEGPGGATPGPLVKIPGMYSTTDPGIDYNKWSPNPPPYVMPGPAVWSDDGSGAGAADPPASTPSAPATPPTAPENPGSPPVATSVVPTPPGNPPAQPPAQPPSQPTPPAQPPSNPPTSPPGGGGGSVERYGQCGGSSYTGATECASGTTCTEINPYYSQCL